MHVCHGMMNACTLMWLCELYVHMYGMVWCDDMWHECVCIRIETIWTLW